MAWHRCYSIDNGRAQGLTKTPREHTMKAYEIKNTHEAFNETEATNKKLHDLIDKAWDTCESIDYIPEWGEQGLGTIIEALRDYGKGKLANELESEAIKAYGDTEATMREDLDPYGWDW